MQDEQEAMIAKLVARDEAGLGLLIAQYGDFVLQVIWHQLPAGYQRDYTSDIANRCYYQVWSKITQFDASKGSFKSWLGVIVKHQTIDYQRGLGGSYANLDLADVVIATPPPDDPLDLAPLLMLLNEREAEIFQLYFQADLTPEEIAKKLHMRRGAVYKQLSRARHKLKKEANKNDFID